jgi:hypothetical protein
MPAKDPYTAFEEADERKAERAGEAARNAADKRERQRQKREAQRRAAKKSRPPPPPFPSTAPVSTADPVRTKHLRTLGLTSTQDTALQIRAAYHQMALRYHPDKNPAPNAAALFRAVKAAYDGLVV